LPPIQSVGIEIQSGVYKANKHIHHTHKGCIGDLCNDHIAAYINKIIDSFDFAKAQEAEQQLLK